MCSSLLSIIKPVWRIPVDDALLCSPQSETWDGRNTNQEAHFRSGCRLKPVVPLGPLGRCITAAQGIPLPNTKNIQGEESPRYLRRASEGSPRMGGDPATGLQRPGSPGVPRSAFAIGFPCCPSGTPRGPGGPGGRSPVSSPPRTLAPRALGVLL